MPTGCPSVSRRDWRHEHSIEGIGDRVSTVHERLRDDIIAQLKDEYDLCYVAYDDRLSDTQIAALVRGDWETFDEDNWEWFADNRRDGATHESKDEIASVVKDWEEHDRVKTYVDAGEVTDWAEGDYPYDQLADAFEYTEEWHEVIGSIQDRDISNPYRDLAHQSGTILMRQVIAGEDAALYGNHTPTAVIEWLKESAEEGTVLKRNKHNLDVVRSVIAESMHSLGYSMGMLVYAMDVGDLYDMPYDTEWVEIINPFLYIGNYYQGDGYCSEQPLHATFRVKRADLRTDKDAPGYGWNEVAGVYTSAYECKVRAVPTTTKGEAA